MRACTNLSVSLYFKHHCLWLWCLHQIIWHLYETFAHKQGLTIINIIPLQDWNMRTVEWISELLLRYPVSMWLTTDRVVGRVHEGRWSMQGFLIDYLQQPFMEQLFPENETSWFLGCLDRIERRCRHRI